MKCRTIFIAMMATTLAGCLNRMPKISADARSRMDHARAQVDLGVGEEYLKVGQLDKARDKAERALLLDKDYFEARLLLGKVLIEQGQYALAAMELGIACDQRPRSAEASFLLGVAYEKSGRLDEALVSYRKALVLNPGDMGAVMACTEVLVAMGKIRQAQLYVQSYLDRAGDEAGLFELAGRLAAMQDDHAKAAQYYQHAHDIDPKNVRYRGALAKAQFFANQYAQAEETLLALSQLKDYDPPYWVFAMLGDCCMAQGKVYQARDAYQEATDRNPSVAGLWSNLAKASLALGDIPGAISAARCALQLDADSLEATMLLGYAMLRNGEARRAGALLAAAADRHGQNVILQCLLGRSYAAAGNKALAQRCYAAALQAEPDNQLARRLLDQMEAGLSLEAD